MRRSDSLPPFDACFGFPRPRLPLSGGDGRVSQVPGRPRCVRAVVSSDPGGAADARPSRRRSVACRNGEGVGLPDDEPFGAPYTARTLPVYASRRRLPDAAQHSVPAGGQPWPGGCRDPQGRNEGFRSRHATLASSFSKLLGAPPGFLQTWGCLVGTPAGPQSLDSRVEPRCQASGRERGGFDR